MFRTNAFGQRILCMPRLMFTDPPEGGGGGGAGGAGGEDPNPGDLGFPSGTPLDQMTVEQREAYWKHQSRKHENTAKSRADYDELKAKAEKLDQIEADNATEQEKAVNAAREEGRRDGENIGAERYLKDAVKGHFRAVTGKSPDEVEKAFEHIDAKSFVTEAGDIDTTKLDEFAKSFVGADGDGNPLNDPVRAAIERQQRGGGTGNSAGSISELRAQARERLSPTKQ